MGFLIVAAACIAGLFLGAVSGDDGDIAMGFFGGLAIGIAYARIGALNQRVAALQRELHAARGTASLAASSRVDTAQLVTVAETPPPPAAASPAAPPPAPSEAIRASHAEPIILAPPPAPPIKVERTPPASPPPIEAERAPPAAATPMPSAPPTRPDAFNRVGAAIRRWFTEGNVPVKIGMLVLFAGVAALLKYAADQGWLSVPVELRLAGIAAAAMAALAFGWRERLRRRAFALSLQGGAIGILILTVFAALRLYHLLPSSAAFLLLILLVAGAGLLAVLQDAIALAVLGLLAGFAAPILIATGSGDHVALFSYYLVLNLAILAIAWRKSWRVLNLLGFFFTFAIGTGWGVLRYQPALLASTEPFLLAFFAIYLAVPILYAMRSSEPQRHPVDGTLVFGNPLFAFALQAALLQGERMPLAWTALGLAALYLLLAGWQRARRRLLGDAFAVLAIGFATLAIPLALSARATGSLFALEGAALIWLGLRQQRWLPQVVGLVLQGLAAAAFVLGSFDFFETGGVPIANPTCISALLITLAALASAWLYHRNQRSAPALLLYLWGLLWWCATALHEIERFVPYRDCPAAMLAWLALSLALLALATRATRARATAISAAALYLLTIGVALWMAFEDMQPLAGWSLGAVIAHAAAGLYGLHVLGQRGGRSVAVAHSAWVWGWICLLAVALQHATARLDLGSGWRMALTTAPLLLAWALTLLRPHWIAVPLRKPLGWRRPLLLLLGLAATWLFCLLLWQAGSSAPLPWLPLLNPLELLQLGMLALGARWLAEDPGIRPLRVPLLAGAGFAFVTAATLRAVHQLGGVPWDDHLWSSNLAQMALTLVWSALGVIGWIGGSRRGHRLLWLAGAVLMGIVLAKLLLIDRDRLGNLFGIASFIAYGLLCTAIGYFAPAPPRNAPREDAP